MKDDTIKRSDAIKAVWGDDINPSGDGMVFEAQSHIDRDMRLIPSADRPQGEWIGVEEDWRHQIEFWKCSECDFAVSSMYNYCPNCGARMKGADDE